MTPRDRRALLTALCVCLALPGPAAAQGITGAGLEGVVRGEGEPLAEAAVLVTNTATGERWRTVTSSGGRYAFERLSVGGAYRLEARAIGFAPLTVEPIVLALGERRALDLSLTSVPLALAPLEVHAKAPSPGARNGPGHTINAAQLASLPLLNRDLLELVRESPHATAGVFGVSIAGQGPRQNSFQIDGGENTSLYGQFSARPGGFINLAAPPGGGEVRAISIDAVQEVQVLVAPYDVRQGSFTGGLINAVTKSGTNTVHGSAFATTQNQWLTGPDGAGLLPPDFHTLQYGGTAGGPIVRDRLHWFLAAELQRSLTPYGGALITSDTTDGADSSGVGISYGSASRFQQILRESYGVDPGDIGVPDMGNPAQSLFGKLTFQAGLNSRVELSQSYVHGRLGGVLVQREYGLYGLTSTDAPVTSTTLATRAAWNTAMSRHSSNELLASYLSIKDLCAPAATYSLVQAGADLGALEAGWNPACPGSDLDQHALEVTDNLTFHVGAHRFLAGTHEEFLSFHDPTVFGTAGQWYFANLDDLAARRASEFQRATTGTSETGGSVADFRVRQLGLYVQDEWSPLPRLVLTGGIRLDAPFFPDHPTQNTELLALGIDTGAFPDGQPLWSPRLGATYSLSNAVTLRAGIGLFTGRPPYFLQGDAYRSTGQQEFLLDCVGDDVPDVTLDPTRQPTTCRTATTPLAPHVTFMDPSFRFPQELKLSAGLDAALRGGTHATLDLLVSRSQHQADFVDANLAPTGAVLSGEAGRTLYGTLDESGTPTPHRISGAFTSVVRQGNSSGNRYASVSIGLSRALGRRGELSAAYTYSEAYDRMNPPGGLGISFSGYGLAADQIGGTALDGTLVQRELARSVFDVPHKVRVSGTVGLPLDGTLSIIYEGSSGSPFTYVVDGDINADGFGSERFGQQSNDAVYVPASPVAGGDVMLANADGSPAADPVYGELAAFIADEPCLREHPGTLLPRNACRNPWRTQLDARLAKAVTIGGQPIALTLDVFNLPHLLNEEWGLIRQTADFGLEEVPLVQLVAFDPVHERGVYALRPPDRRHVDAEASRWRMQLGAHLEF